MYSLWLKKMHTKNQEHLRLDEKGQSLDANTDITDMIELSGNILKQL